MANLSTANKPRAGPRRCPKCNKLCETRKDLWIHQTVQGHHLCNECDATFHDDKALVDHKQANHRADQNIVCPGCGETFLRAGAWMHHIEQKQCPVIFPSVVEARRDERLKFAQALQDRNPATRKKLYFHPPSVTKDDGVTKTRLEFDCHRPHDSPDANKLYFRPDDFPRTAVQKFRSGDSKAPDLLTGDNSDPLEQKPGNAWAQKKQLFPNSFQAVPPPPELMENLRQPGPGASSVRPSGERIIDPDDPDFNASLFKCPILGTFKCPYIRCKVKPKTANGLIMHLRSPVHSNVDISCPACKNVFKTMTAWVQHTESSTTCNIRDTEDYRPALGQLTGGILDVHPTKTMKNNTPLFKVDKNFVKEMGYNKPAPIPGLEIQEPNDNVGEEKKKKQENSRKENRKDRQSHR
ncbi:hypothetical protein F5X99DRAFT_422031 [Biscogniauxia marginata]|nr:hypothetical protein F5X99DRAFT_422031 [Biscogniauxia marginata]